MIRIKEIRKAKKITAKQLADFVNVAESTMSLYENGKREPDYETLIRIAEYLDVSVDYLLCRPTILNITDKITVASPKEKPADEGELTEREATVINAYRNQPEMQIAVERLLGIFNDEYVQLYTAASSSDNRPDKIIKMPKEKWDKIKNAPDTDDNLI